MSTERIQAALRDATDTKDVVIAAGVLSSVGEVFDRTFGDVPAVVVADENTYEVAGEEVHRRLQAAGRKMVDPYVFPGRPTLRAEYGNITTLAGWLRTHDAIPVAVASGTLNDIVKRAAHECDRPYLAVATAASVDGYTSFGASITKDGFKQTLTCPAPRAVVADLDLLTAAPAIMTASGYGDLLGKVPAGADWIVADELGVDPIDAARLGPGAGPAAGGDGPAGRAGRRRPRRDAGARRGADDVRAGDAGLGIVPAGVGCRALLQPPVGAGGTGPRRRRRPAARARPEGRLRLDRDRRLLREAASARSGRDRRRRPPRRLAELGRGGASGAGDAHDAGSGQGRRRAEPRQVHRRRPARRAADPGARELARPPRADPAAAPERRPVA